MRYDFPSDTSLFRNRDMLEFDFIPEPFRYRERQLRDLAFALSPWHLWKLPVQHGYSRVPRHRKDNGHPYDVCRA